MDPDLIPAFVLGIFVGFYFLFKRTSYCTSCHNAHPRRPENMTAHEYNKFFCPGPKKLKGRSVWNLER